ncbi:MAG: hypothetical protein PHZ19_11545 [Candidatus Thermoplasmatota archaeon]|nr:hypothetical protein [Candidatus Thermoplasmatota archaeon]
MATIRWGTDVGADVCLPFVGNSVLDAARYIGAGDPDDDVALAWNEFASDVNTVGLWHGNEGTGTLVADASGQINGTLQGDQSANWLLPGWLGSAALAPNGAASIAVLGAGAAYAGAVSGVPDFCFEAWLRWDALPSSFDFIAACTWDWWDYGNWHVRIRDERNLYFALSVGGNALTELGAMTFITDALLGTWVHLCCEKSGTARTIYRNGTAVASDMVAGDVSIYDAGVLFPYGAIHGIKFRRSYDQNPVHFGDEYRLSNVARYSADFSPTRYPASGTVVAVTPLALPRTINAIAWAATTGVDIGDVYQIHVNTGTDLSPVWTQVGGDNPTSPITPIGLATTAADLVRVTLTPGFDATLSATLQNETPVLDWLEVDWAAVGGARAQYPRLSYGHLIGG